MLQFLRLMVPLMRNINPDAVPDEIDTNGLPVGNLEQFRDFIQAGANFQGIADGPGIGGVDSDDFDEDEDEDDDMEDNSEDEEEDDDESMEDDNDM